MRTHQTAEGGPEEGQDSRRDRSGCSEDEAQVSTQTGLQEEREREMNEEMNIQTLFCLAHTSHQVTNITHISISGHFSSNLQIAAAWC